MVSQGMSNNNVVILPVINLSLYLACPDSKEAIAESKKAVEALRLYSAFAIRDDRVSMDDNAVFLDMMEDYFNQSLEVKMKDTRKEFSYQVGATPSNTEKPRCGNDDNCLEYVESLAEENKPLDFSGFDPKWRFFWRMGEMPKTTAFPSLNAAEVIPAAFPHWEKSMNTWGNSMLTAVSDISRVIAVGLNLPENAFTNLTRFGPHLLAPTASDLSDAKIGTVLAGFHTDLNLLTIHGKSRFAGLSIWTPNGQKVLVKIPDGCLLVQAGQQMEKLTGGEIKSGYHEVTIVKETMPSIEKQRSEGRPLWRISSTLFFHMSSDEYLQPLMQYANDASNLKYGREMAGIHVQRELGLISLSNIE